MPNARIRPWVLLAGCALAFLGAAVNAWFLFQFGTSVSHLTGDVSKVAMSVAEQHSVLTPAALNLCAATLGFLGGATLAGFTIHHPTVEPRRPYECVILGIAMLLGGAAITTGSYPLASILLAAWACGMQNALATHYRGMILRTTHITGLLTDFGVNLGMKLRGHQIPAWKLAVPFALMISFFAGAAAGSVGYMKLRGMSLVILSGAYAAGAISWMVFQRSYRSIEK